MNRRVRNRTHVVWEDGGGNPASYPIAARMDRIGSAQRFFCLSIIFAARESRFILPLRVPFLLDFCSPG